MAAGRKTGGGSRKGRPNKLTADLKAMILGALDKAGGEAYLLRQAHENPTAFMRLLGKILPHQIGGAGDPIDIRATISLEKRRRQAIAKINAAFAEPPSEREGELAVEKAWPDERQGSATPDGDHGEHGDPEVEIDRSALPSPREYAREGELEAAPSVARLPTRYRRPRVLGDWSN